MGKTGQYQGVGKNNFRAFKQGTYPTAGVTRSRGARGVFDFAVLDKFFRCTAANDILFQENI